MAEWFILFDQDPLPGTRNMAVDEYLFRLAKSSLNTYLRFYTWLRPTASLGCSQEVSRVVNLEECQKRGVDVVRRMTGGKMVLHHLEVTYSVASSRADIFSATLEGSYRLISEALVKGLKLMGLQPELSSTTAVAYARSNMPCFAYPARNEIEINNRKIIGSAQKRTGTAFIQHGSIPLAKELELLSAISLGLDPSRQGSMTSLFDELGREISYQEAAGYFQQGFEQFFEIKTAPLEFKPGELHMIERIEKNKYASHLWTLEKAEAEGV
jgi:lipoate-protein ligase A